MCSILALSFHIRVAAVVHGCYWCRLGEGAGRGGGLLEVKILAPLLSSHAGPTCNLFETNTVCKQVRLNFVGI